MTSWKTTLTAALTAFFLFVMFKPQYFPPILVDLAAFAAAGNLVAFGVFSKDKDVHSTTAEVTKSTEKALAKAVPMEEPHDK